MSQFQQIAVIKNSVKTGFALLLIFYLTGCGLAGDNRSNPSDLTNDTATVNALIESAAGMSQLKPDSQFVLLSNALAASRNMHYAAGIAKTQASLAIYYRARANFVDAVACSLSAINLFDSLHQAEKKINAQLALSTIYKEMGGEKGTMDYLNKAYSLARQAGQSAEQVNYVPGIVNSLNNQGIILRDMSKAIENPGLMDSAFEKYQRAILLVKQTGDKTKVLAKLYNNISQVYIEWKKNFPRALEVLNEAIALNQANNRTDELTFNFANMSNVYLAMGYNNRAKEYALKMLELSKALKRPHRVLNAYQHIVKVNKRLKLYDSALYYTNLYIDLSDSLTNLAKTEQISDMQTRYETVKKELQITQLSKSGEAQKRKTIWAIAIAVFLAILAYLFYNRYRFKKKTSEALTEKNIEIERQKALIQTSLNEKETLLREIHHRVKNNLQIISSLLNIQSEHIQDENVLSSIQEGQSRVQAMSLIHQNLYQSEHLNNVDIQNYVQQLVVYLSEMFAGQSKNIQVKVDAPGINFDIDTAIPLGLIINELVSNAYKYAFEKHSPGKISISIKPNAGAGYELEIRDDGKGMPADINPDKSNSLGLKLVKILSRQLRGTFSFKSDKGAVFLVQFKDLRAYQTS